MKTKFIILSTICAALILFLNSCDNDPVMDAVAPVFSDITITPSNPQPGDSVTVVANYESEGKKWYKVKYSWSLTGPKEYSLSGAGQCGFKEKPTFGFVIPSNASGTYTLKFSPGYVFASSLFPVGNYGTLEVATTIKNGTKTFNF